MESIQGNTKQMPQAVEMELAVLGAMMIDRTSPDLVLPIIKSSGAFYEPKHQYIFEAISQLYIKGIGVDILTVSNELKVMGKLDQAGGDFHLINIANKVSSSAHVEYHSRVVMQQFLRRMIITFNAQITAMALDDSTDVFELISKWQKEFDKVADITTAGRKSLSFKDSLEHLKKEIEQLSSKNKENELVGVDTGFQKTNNFTGGYRSQDLVILAARPGMGKTAKVLKTAVANIRKGVPVGFISLEMSVHQLTARCVAIDTDFHLKQLLKSGFDKPQYFESYSEHQQRMEKYPFYIDDSGSGDIADVVMTAKLWKRMHGIELLVVDYLQLMGDRSVKGHRENEISSISRRLKLLAKELEIPIIALSQLSRAVETRGGNKRPMLSDLRESGSIEQDADIVEFIYRPEYYDIDINDTLDYYNDTNQTLVSMGANTEIIYAKYRGGSTATTLLKWVGDKTKFIDVEDANDVANYIDGKSTGVPF